ILHDVPSLHLGLRSFLIVSQASVLVKAPSSAAMSSPSDGSALGAGGEVSGNLSGPKLALLLVRTSCSGSSTCSLRCSRPSHRNICILGGKPSPGVLMLALLRPEASCVSTLMASLARPPRL